MSLPEPAEPFGERPRALSSGIMRGLSPFMTGCFRKRSVTGSRMRKNLWFWLTVVFAVAALVASAILLVDYVRPAPVFCEAGGGCGKVRATIFARPFGIPLPAIGIAGIFG